MIDYLATFIAFFAVIDPIGTVPIFVAVTAGYDAGVKRRIAITAIFVSAVVLTFFVVAGELILSALDIPLAAFQISGGIVLFLFALTMIFGDSKPEEEARLVEGHNETAIYPLAVPSIAGPGAMLAAVLLTEDSRFSLTEQIQIIGVMLLVLALALVLMLLASRIDRIIGNAGASVISRVMGIILTAVAATNVLNGIKDFFGL